MTSIQSKQLIRTASLLFVSVLMCSEPTVANDMDWIQNKDEMNAVSTLAAGYAGGLRCDRLVDADVAGQFLNAAFPGRSFSAIELAKFAKIVDGVIAMQAASGSNPKYCAQVRAYFGPAGSVIKGLLD